MIDNCNSGWGTLIIILQMIGVLKTVTESPLVRSSGPSGRKETCSPYPYRRDEGETLIKPDFVLWYKLK